MPSHNIKTEEKKSRHQHAWSYRLPDRSCQRCNCGAYLVSQAEYDRRLEEWNNFYELTRTTESYRDYSRGNQLLKIIRTATSFPGEKELAQLELKEIAARAKMRLESSDDYLPKPSFPDPSKPWVYEIVGGGL